MRPTGDTISQDDTASLDGDIPVEFGGCEIDDFRVIFATNRIRIDLIVQFYVRNCGPRRGGYPIARAIMELGRSLGQCAYVRPCRTQAARTRALDTSLHMYNPHRPHTAVHGPPVRSQVHLWSSRTTNEAHAAFGRIACQPSTNGPQCTRVGVSFACQ